MLIFPFVLAVHSFLRMYSLALRMDSFVLRMYSFVLRMYSFALRHYFIVTRNTGLVPYTFTKKDISGRRQGDSNLDRLVPLPFQADCLNH